MLKVKTTGFFLIPLIKKKCGLIFYNFAEFFLQLRNHTTITNLIILATFKFNNLPDPVMFP